MISPAIYVCSNNNFRGISFLEPALVNHDMRCYERGDSWIIFPLAPSLFGLNDCLFDRPSAATLEGAIGGGCLGRGIPGVGVVDMLYR